MENHLIQLKLLDRLFEEILSSIVVKSEMMGMMMQEMAVIAAVI